jgi:hypothetical protein
MHIDPDIQKLNIETYVQFKKKTCQCIQAITTSNKTIVINVIKVLKDFTIVWHIAWNKRMATLNVC